LLCAKLLRSIASSIFCHSTSRHARTTHQARLDWTSWQLQHQSWHLVL
jgi:hypothetical protein